MTVKGLTWVLQCDLNDFCSKTHHTLMRTTKFCEKEIINENDEIEEVIQIMVFDNTHTIKESGAYKLILNELEKLGLKFIRMDSEVFCGNIARNFYFRL